MSVIRLTKEFTFEAAHMLEGYDGLCREIHGHSYRLFVTIKGEPQGEFAIQVPGEHNVLNALAAIAAARYSGVSYGGIALGLQTFMGAIRRFEKIDTVNGITIVDDYAHHPQEISCTLKAAKGLDFKRVWAVFQPFTYSRTAMHFDEFVDVLKIPDKCVMTEIMGSREVNTYDIYTSQLSEKIPGSVWFNTQEEVADYVVKNAKAGDLVLTMGCGDIYKSAFMMIERLKNGTV